jgi:ferredoxin/menaquinone-dependent protoporphyrinogen IX oxidase
MKIKQVTLVYFSPTGTTRKVLESIARGIGAEGVEYIDLTLPSGTQHTITPFSDELVIIGSPVYGGRLPIEVIKRFRQLTARKAIAIPVVVYGNREFEDALLELKNLSIELGFYPVAAAAFIGEHSFATEDVPIANGRPDKLDILKAVDFGSRVANKVKALESREAQLELHIPGRFPYEGGAQSMRVSPVTREGICTVCGTCASVCPTAAIQTKRSVVTSIGLCIRCCACIKNCPEGARHWVDGTMKEIANWLNENCRTRKEPRIFGIDVSKKRSQYGYSGM